MKVREGQESKGVSGKGGGRMGVRREAWSVRAFGNEECARVFLSWLFGQVMRGLPNPSAQEALGSRSAPVSFSLVIPELRHGLRRGPPDQYSSSSSRWVADYRPDGWCYKVTASCWSKVWTTKGKLTCQAGRCSGMDGVFLGKEVRGRR